MGEDNSIDSSDRYPRWVRALAAAGERRGGVIAAVCILFAAAGAAMAPTIRLDARIEALLPTDAVREGALAEAQARYAADAPLFFIVQSPDPRLNRTLTGRILEEVERWEDLDWAIDRRDPTSFSEARLLFVETELLARTADELEAIEEWENCEGNPLCVTLEDRPPDPDVDRLSHAIEGSAAVATLAGLFGARDLASFDEMLARSNEQDDGSPRIGDLCRPDGQLCLVQAHVRGDPADFAYAEALGRRAQELLDRVRPGDAPVELAMRVAGRASRLADRQNHVREDLARTGALGLALVGLLLVLQFRGTRSFVLLMVPIAVGAGWTALAVELSGISLNVVSAATLVIMTGIGIDFGVHLTTHYGAAHGRGLSSAEALRDTLLHLGPSLLLAALTTAACFAALATGRFAGFAQMGALCAVGILLTFVAFTLLFPALTALSDRWGLGTSTTRRSLLPSLAGPFGRASAWVLAVTGLAVIVLGVLALPSLEYEHDLSTLETPPPPEVRRRLSHSPALPGTTRSPTLLLADDEAALQRAVAGLEEMYPEGLIPGEPWLITPSTFIPPDQGRRLAEVARARHAVDSLWPHLDDHQRARLEPWRGYLEVETPIEPESLPGWARNIFSERDGTFGTIGILYEGGLAADGLQMARRAERLRDWHRRFPDVHFASQAALLGDVTRTLQEDTPRVVGLAALALVLGTLLIGRSATRTALVAAPVLLSVAVCVLVMAAFDLRVHLYNLIVFPLAFGVGVDGAVYVVFRVMRGRGRLNWGELPVTARAVLGSTATTLAAFGSLSISHNPGLSSLGVLSLVTLGATLVANLLWLPAVLTLIGGRSVEDPPTLPVDSEPAGGAT